MGCIGQDERSHADILDELEALEHLHPSNSYKTVAPLKINRELISPNLRFHLLTDLYEMNRHHHLLT